MKKLFGISIYLIIGVIFAYLLVEHKAQGSWDGEDGFAFILFTVLWPLWLLVLGIVNIGEGVSFIVNSIRGY